MRRDVEERGSRSRILSCAVDRSASSAIRKGEIVRDLCGKTSFLHGSSVETGAISRKSSAKPRQDVIERHREDGHLVLQLAHGRANALDLELLEALIEAVAEFEASDAPACILTGTKGFFSAGVDLKRLAEGGDAYLDRFLPALDQAFTSLFFSSRPIIGACTGHAIAGGCLLLSCCDVRIGVRGKGRIGVPELAVGVPFPSLALEIVRFVVPPHRLQEVVYGAAAYDVDSALERGLVDELVEPDELDARAAAWAAKLAAIPHESFAWTKTLVRRPVAERMATHGESDAAATREAWGSPAVREALERYVAQTLG